MKDVRKYNYVLSILFMFTLGVLLFISLTFKVDNVKVITEDIRNFNDGWTCLNDSGIKKFVDLPQKAIQKKNEILTLINRLPEGSEGLTLSFRTSDQLLKVFFDGIETYNYGHETTRLFGQTPGSAWHFIQIPSNLTKREIKIELVSPYNNYSINLPSIWMGTKSACIMHLINQNLFSLIICFVTILFGLALLIFYLFIRHLNNRSYNLLYLGEFTIIMGLASLIETRLLQFWVGNQNIFSNGIFLLHMLAPMPLILYLMETYFMSMKRQFKIILNVLIANFILLCGLQLFQIYDFMETNWIFQTIVVFVCFFSFLCILRLLKNTEKDPGLNPFCGALGVLIICIILDVLGFYVLKSGDATLFQRLGLLYFIISLSFIDIRKLVRLIKQGAEASTLRHLAYQDILTKCKNRIYFEEKFSEIQKQLPQISNAVIVIFDINNLKTINDQKGHYEGDSTIIQAAKLIKHHFSKYAKISRIGGDEFAFILVDVPRIQLEESFIEFENAMEEQLIDQGAESKIAYGYAYYDPEIDIDLQATFIRADSNMYDCKKNMKECV